MIYFGGLVGTITWSILSMLRLRLREIRANLMTTISVKICGSLNGRNWII